MTGARSEPPVVRLERVCKAVPQDGRAERHVLLDTLLGRRRGQGLRPGERWAVRDVTLSVRRGERVAILASKHGDGAVLAGLIGGLLLPDAGSLAVDGPCALWNQLGKGFKPMLTVWENLQFYAVLMGAPAAGLVERCRRSLAFAGLEGFERRRLQDLSPVQVRCLAFSALLETDAQVLVIHGVSVPGGDLAFEERARAALRERLRTRTAIVFAHRPKTLPEELDRALVFKDGGLLTFPDPGQALAYWEQHGAGLDAAGAGRGAPDDDDDGGGLGPDDADEAGAEEAPLPGGARCWAGEARDVSVDGVPSAFDRMSFLLRPGTVITVQFTLAMQADHACHALQLRLTGDELKVPVAAYALPARDVEGSQDGALRLQQGRSYRFSVELAVPPVQRGRFRLSVALLGHDDARRPPTFKLAAFGTRTDQPRGPATLLDVRGARLVEV